MNESLTLLRRAALGRAPISFEEAARFRSIVRRSIVDADGLDEELRIFEQRMRGEAAFRTAVASPLAWIARAAYLALADRYDALHYCNPSRYADFELYIQLNPFGDGGGRWSGREAHEASGFEAPEYRNACDWGSAIAVYARCLSILTRGGCEARRQDIGQLAGWAVRLLESCPARQPSASDRINVADRGSREILGLFLGFLRALRAAWELSADPRAFLARRIDARRAHAALHHRCAALKGRNLAAWFADVDFRAEDLLDALLHSPWVDRSCVEHSRLFSQLTNFGRPMHGVFDDYELLALRHWIARGDEPTNSSPARMGSELPGEVAAALAAPAASSRPRIGGERVKMRARDLFAQLVRDPTRAAVQEAARHHIHSALADLEAAKALAGDDPELAEFDYSPAGLEDRIEIIYAAQQNVAAPTEILPLALVARLHLNSSPLSLVDGCWLGGWALFADPKATWARNLHRIYLEEVGAATLAANHAHLFAKLLRELGLAIPALDTEAFCNSEYLPDGHFDLAAAMLALNMHGAQLIPELIGFTLSVEMFGLGSAYTAMLHQLQGHNLDPAFWSVHISVDSLSRGHSALARDAVLSYMGELTSMGLGADAIQAAWSRVWNGFGLFRYKMRHATEQSLKMMSQPPPQNWLAAAPRPEQRDCSGSVSG